MTTPTIVITVEGGLVTDVSSSHQATVVFVDYDTEGTNEPLRVVGSGYATVCRQDLLPDLSQELWIAEVLESLK